MGCTHQKPSLPSCRGEDCVGRQGTQRITRVSGLGSGSRAASGTQMYMMPCFDQGGSPFPEPSQQVPPTVSLARPGHLFSSQSSSQDSHNGLRAVPVHLLGLSTLLLGNTRDRQTAAGGVQGVRRTGSAKPPDDPASPSLPVHLGVNTIPSSQNALPSHTRSPISRCSSS